MRFTKAMFAAAALTVLGSVSATAQGQPRIYAYTGTHNFCPAGLQPVTMNGEICCGQPNQTMSYQQVKAHPVKRHVHRAASRVDCPIGTKGCTFD